MPGAVMGRQDVRFAHLRYDTPSGMSCVSEVRDILLDGSVDAGVWRLADVVRFCVAPVYLLVVGSVLLYCT